MGKTIIHLKGLNGIRAIAALSVVLSHIFLQPWSFELALTEAGESLGSYGVTLFFTLSGFLITYLLLQEKKQFGAISIREFYMRRALRVWPLYYFYLLLVLIVMLLNREQPGSNLAYYVFMAANIASILGAAPVLLQHYWSLGVEEQFYLFWPWLVKYYSPLRSISIFLALFILAKALLRFYLPDSFAYWFLFSSRFDCMAIGALFAILIDSKKQFLRTVCFNRVVQIICWLILLLGAIGKFQLLGFIDHDIFSVVSAIVIINVAFNKNTILALENKLLDFLGKISYGIYVYHILVVYMVNRFLLQGMKLANDVDYFILLALLTFSFTILIAWLSYEFFEKRFLILKQRFSKIFSRI